MKLLYAYYILSYCVVAIITATSQTLASSAKTPPVLDTAGEPLRRGVEYFISPAITDVGGRLTPIDRFNNCTYYVGQENDDSARGFPVIFEPFDGDEPLVRVSRDFKATFSVITTCITSTTWGRNGERDPVTRRRLIRTGTGSGVHDYFRIEELEPRLAEGIYRIRWCPMELCPMCGFECGTFGGLVEDGKILMALDGSVLPVMFEKA